MQMRIFPMLIMLTLPLLTAQSAPPPHAAILPDLAMIGQVAVRSSDHIWPGYATAPFGFLLIHEDGETLINDSRTPDGFARSGTGRDSVAIGPRSWRRPSLLAAMPAFGAPSVIVMGSPEATGLSRQRWQLTILHEHFHQWQASLPGYYDRVDALDLAGGDATGMWMLNYAFPYADTMPAYGVAARELRSALDAANPNALRIGALRYLRARRALQNSVSAPQWRYFDFQLWQEGVARWTEIEIGLRSGNRQLAQEARATRAATLNALSQAASASPARELVYPLGAGEAMLLDRLDSDWRGCYRVVMGMTPCWDSLNLEVETQG